MKKWCAIFSILIISFLSSSAQKITLEEVAAHMGSTVTVCGKIYNGVLLSNIKNTPTLLNMGGSYPNQLLTLVIFNENIKDFPAQPEVHFANTQVCVTGLVIEYKGKPEIVLRSPGQIQIESPGLSSRAPTSASSKASTNNNKTNTTPVTKPPVSSTTNTPAANPITTSSNPKPTAITLGTDDIQLTGNVDMRSGPSLDYTLVEQVKTGSIVTVVFSNNGWSQVIIKDSSNKDAVGKEGYIKNSVLK